MQSVVSLGKIYGDHQALVRDGAVNRSAPDIASSGDQANLAGDNLPFSRLMKRNGDCTVPDGSVQKHASQIRFGYQPKQHDCRCAHSQKAWRKISTARGFGSGI